MAESIDNFQNTVRISAERGEQRLATALSSVSGSANALAAMQGASLPNNRSENGQLIAGEAVTFVDGVAQNGLNAGLNVNDPDYDPILDQLPNVYETYWLAGELVAEHPVAPF